MRDSVPKIGIFDSGIGGLTVLGECFRLYPWAKYYYLGDNGRAPYGNRSEAEICSFVREGLTVFEKLGVDAAVLACNTATAVCIEEMRRSFPFPIIGTEPAVRLAAKECKNALILATVRTARSERLRKLIDSCASCTFKVLPCPDLAGEIERAVHCGEPMGNFVHLPFYGKNNPDGVVLGCTHYIFLKEKIADFYGCKTYDGNRGVAEELFRRLGIGRVDHHFLKGNPNVCFEINMKKLAKEGVIFLGSAKNFNQITFFANVCFRCF